MIAKRNLSEQSSPGDQKISVVLPVYNPNVTIMKTIYSIATQSLLPNEVIIVDDGSTSNKINSILFRIKNILKSKEILVRIIRSMHLGRAYAKNKGWKLAKSEIIVFIEDDAVYSQDYLKNISRSFLDKSIVGAVGPYYVYQPKSFLEKMRNIERKFNFIDYKPFNAWAYRRNTLNSLNGFDNTLNHGEDVDLGTRTKSAGYRIIFNNEAIWYHKEPERFTDFLKRRFIGGIGIYFLRKKHKKPIIDVRYTVILIGFISYITALLFYPSLILLCAVAPIVMHYRWIVNADQVKESYLHILLATYVNFLSIVATFFGILYALTNSNHALYLMRKN